MRLTVIVVVILAFIGGFLLYQNQNKPSFQNSDRSSQNGEARPSLKTSISYNLPKGWKEEDISLNYKSDEALSFISEDFEENAIPQVTRGAKIFILRSKHDPDKSLKEEILASLPVPLQEKTDTEKYAKDRDLFLSSLQFK